jgi:PAS domain S-box-containing protein
LKINTEDVDSLMLTRKRTESLYHVARSLMSIGDLRELIQTVADRVVEALPADRVVVVTLDMQARKVIHFIQGGAGYDPEDTLTYEELDQGLTGWVLRELKPTLSPWDILDSRESPEVRARRVKTGTGDVAVVPLMFRESILGTMTAINVVGGTRLGEEEVELMMAMAGQISLAIQNARLYSEMMQQKLFSEALVQNSPVAIVTTDRDNRVTTWNPAAEKLFGFPVDKALGMNIEGLISMPCNLALVEEYDLMTRMEANGEKIHSITQRCLQDGSTVDVEIYGAPVWIEGQPKIYLKIYHDITELKSVQNDLIRANETVEKANKLLDDANQKMEKELILAGDIQASFLPQRIPKIDGWQIATYLKPSRETSGDFYDLEVLSKHHLGFLIADVVDKGAGAAIFMALSWTLIRTHASRYYSKLSQMFSKVNRHIIEETHSNQFLTAIYGTVDTRKGSLTYCNAGHNLPILYKPQVNSFTRLASTGYPLGVFRDTSWEQGSIVLDAGDILVLYTDGVTDAINDQGEFFDEPRLLQVIEENQQRNAQQIVEAIVDAIHQFTGSENHEDDITLMVIVRENPSPTLS